MRTMVRDDIATVIRRRWRRSVRAIALSLAVLVPALSASGQDADPPELTTQVLDFSRGRHRVTISIYASTVIETSVEIDRVDAVERGIADAVPISARQLLISGKNYGTTHIVLWSKDDRQALVEVTVGPDLSLLSEGLKQIDPLGDARASSVMGNIILSGRVSGADAAQRMVEHAHLFLPPRPIGDRRAPAVVQNHLDIAGEQQVLLRVVVAEVSRSSTKQLGVNGFLAGENFRDGFVVNQIGGINPINIGAAADALVTQNIPFLTGTDGIPISPSSTLSLGFPRVQMQLFLDAMSNNNLLKILAEPNLVSISGETATFLAGGEFPIPVPQGDEVTTIAYREFGVRLNFTPVVRSNQRIRLNVRPEVSELDFTNGVQLSGTAVPGLSTRSVETTIEVGNGQTIAIAGLLSEETRGLASRIPGIGDIPVLGALFRSVDYRRSETELVILVTPEIVAPLDPHQLIPMPGEGIIPPTDLELYFMGRLEGKQASNTHSAPSDGNKPIPSQPDNVSIHGPWGHTMTSEYQ